MGNYAKAGRPTDLGRAGGNMPDPMMNLPPIVGGGEIGNQGPFKRRKSLPIEDGGLGGNTPAPDVMPRMRFGASLGQPTAYLGGSSTFDERGGVGELGGIGQMNQMPGPYSPTNLPAMNPYAGMTREDLNPGVRPGMRIVNNDRRQRPLSSIGLNTSRRF